MHHEALRTCLMRCRSVGVLRRKTAGAALKPARYYQTGALLLGQCATRAALIDLRLVVAHERHFGAVFFSKNWARAVGPLRNRPPFFCAERLEISALAAWKRTLRPYRERFGVQKIDL